MHSLPSMPWSRMTWTTISVLRIPLSGTFTFTTISKVCLSAAGSADHRIVELTL